MAELVVATLLTAAGATATQIAIANIIYQAARAAHQRRKASANARRAYNASLRDRLVMADVEADAARTIVYGRARTVEGIRRRWVSGTHNEKMTLLISLAGHEIDAVEQVYFDDKPVTLDAEGWVQSEPYIKVGRDQRIYEGPSAGVVTLPADPVAGSVHAVVPSGSMDQLDTVLSITVAGRDVTTGVHANVVITYQVATAKSKARVRAFLGAPGQNVGTALGAEYPGKLLTTDRFAGIALLAVDLIYDPDVYTGAPPNITAVIRGKKILDTRTGVTAWSDNPALCAYDYARHPNGWAVPADEITTADVNATASACDISTSFTVTKPTGAVAYTLPLYRCGIVISTDGDPRASMDEICESMAGDWAWSGGLLRFRAGVYTAPVATIDESWIMRPMEADGTPTGPAPVRITRGVRREQRVNALTGRFADSEQRYQSVPFPAVRPAGWVAEDGGEYPRDVEYQAINHIAHAQHVAHVQLREERASTRLTLTCGVKAYPLEVFDVVNVVLPRYGISAPYTVEGWSWHPEQGIQLVLKATGASIYSVASTLNGWAPAPASDLPTPWQVEDVVGLTITSGTTILTDASVVARVEVSWDQAISDAVRQGGRVEVQYADASALPTDTDWSSIREQGDAQRLVIPGLRSGKAYLFRARFGNGLAYGRWCVNVAHVVATRRGPRSLTQPSAPTGSVQDGDEWIDSDDGNRRYLREAGVWVPKPIGTGGLTGNAATDVAIDSGGTGAVGELPGATSTSTDVYVRTASWTNATGLAKPVQFEAGINNSRLSYDGDFDFISAAVIMEWASASVSGSAVLQDGWPDSALSSYGVSANSANQVIVPAGETLTVRLRAILSHPSGAVRLNFDASFARLAAIKA